MTETPDGLGAASVGELRAVAAKVELELARREAEDQAARDERWRRELDEVRAGMRPMYPEHIPGLTPAEVSELTAGGVPHLGIGPDRRNRRRR